MLTTLLILYFPGVGSPVIPKILTYSSTPEAPVRKGGATVGLSLWSRTMNGEERPPKLLPLARQRWLHQHVLDSYEWN